MQHRLRTGWLVHLFANMGTGQPADIVSKLLASPSRLLRPLTSAGGMFLTALLSDEPVDCAFAGKARATAANRTMAQSLPPMTVSFTMRC